jgi:hypothetical protein
MFWQVAFLMYLFVDLSSTEPVVSKLLVSFLFDLRCLEIYGDGGGGGGSGGDDDDDDDDVIRYDIYLLQLGFLPVAVVGKLVQKWEKDSTKRERVHKTIQKHKIHKIENKNTKQKTSMKRTLKT